MKLAAYFFVATASISLGAVAGVERFIEVPPPRVSGDLDIVFIGNSITRHAPSTDLDWSGDYGMAATKISRDYVHMTANKLSIPYNRIYARNFYPFETDFSVTDRMVKSTKKAFSKTKFIVIQLGDNAAVNTPESAKSFSIAYSKLVESVPKNKKLLCLGVYWDVPEKNKIIKESCEARGGKFIDISNAETLQRANMPAELFSNAGVNAHPHDYAMNYIASKIASEIKKDKITSSKK